MKQREIKFRIKIKDNYGGGWDYAEMDENNCLYWSKSVDSHEKGTRGEFTGSLDKDRQEIYEGDIVKNENGGIFEVELSIRQGIKYLSTYNYSELDALEVIGNIYENKDLLKS